MLFTFIVYADYTDAIDETPDIERIHCLVPSYRNQAVFSIPSEILPEVPTPPEGAAGTTDCAAEEAGPVPGPGSRV